MVAFFRGAKESPKTDVTRRCRLCRHNNQANSPGEGVKSTVKSGLIPAPLRKTLSIAHCRMPIETSVTTNGIVHIRKIHFASFAVSRVTVFFSFRYTLPIRNVYSPICFVADTFWQFWGNGWSCFEDDWGALEENSRTFQQVRTSFRRAFDDSLELFFFFNLKKHFETILRDSWDYFKFQEYSKSRFKNYF